MATTDQHNTTQINDITETLNTSFEAIHKMTRTPDIPIGGVVNTNAPEWLYDDMDAAINLSYEEWVKECNPSDEDKESNEECEDTYLIGYILNSDNEYEPDTTADYSAIVSSPYTQIVKSKWASTCGMCSMCYPGQGDLDTKGAQTTYTLPESVWGESEHLNIEKVI